MAETHMAESYLQQLARIAGAVEIQSPFVLLFAGKRWVGPPDQSGRWLVATLAALLYEHCYCVEFSGDLRPPQNGSIENLDLHQLQAANTGRNRLDPGWRVIASRPGGMVYADKNGVRRLFAPGDYVAYRGPGHGTATGEMIAAWRQRDSEHVQPGAYFAFGDAPDSNLLAPECLTRIYWNVAPSAVAILLREISLHFNKAYLPFQFKCFRQSSANPRLDGAVLYIYRGNYLKALPLLGSVCQAIQSQSRAAVPLFTKRIAPGVGLAENPSGQDSFGTHRCRLVAEGFWHAFMQGQHAVDNKIYAVQRRFGQKLISLERPYLNPLSIDRYPALL